MSRHVTSSESAAGLALQTAAADTREADRLRSLFQVTAGSAVAAVAALELQNYIESLC